MIVALHDCDTEPVPHPSLLLPLPFFLLLLLMNQMFSPLAYLLQLLSYILENEDHYDAVQYL